MLLIVDVCLTWLVRRIIITADFFGIGFFPVFLTHLVICGMVLVTPYGRVNLFFLIQATILGAAFSLRFFRNEIELLVKIHHSDGILPNDEMLTSPSWRIRQLSVEIIVSIIATCIMTIFFNLLSNLPLSDSIPRMEVFLNLNAVVIVKLFLTGGLLQYYLLNYDARSKKRFKEIVGEKRISFRSSREPQPEPSPA